METRNLLRRALPVVAGLSLLVAGSGAFTVAHVESVQAKGIVAAGLNFTGTIESMTPSAFVIGGKTFMIDAKTVLDAGLAVGVAANVEFVTQPDGSLLAVKIETLISGKIK